MDFLNFLSQRSAKKVPKTLSGCTNLSSAYYFLISADANAQEWSRVASLLIGVVSMYLVEMRRCCALERTFPVPTEPCITANQVEQQTIRGFFSGSLVLDVPETQNRPGLV